MPQKNNTLDFNARVLSIVKNIPKGETLTYKEVAKRAGNVRATRAVGTLMRKNYNPDIPCHRVIRSDGRVGEYNRGGSVVKEKILKQEGVQVLTKRYSRL